MNPERLYIPGYIGMRNIPMPNSILGINSSLPRGIGLFTKITNGIRSVNWRSLLANTNRTLEVVNQAIPLVRQAGPMISNMRSMLRIAKVFGNETTSNTGRSINHSTTTDSIDNKIVVQKKEVQNDNSPNFFI